MQANFAPRILPCSFPTPSSGDEQKRTLETRQEAKMDIPATLPLLEWKFWNIPFNKGTNCVRRWENATQNLEIPVVLKGELFSKRFPSYVFFFSPFWII